MYKYASCCCTNPVNVTLNITISYHLGKSAQRGVLFPATLIDHNVTEIRDLLLPKLFFLLVLVLFRTETQLLHFVLTHLEVAIGSDEAVFECVVLHSTRILWNYSRYFIRRGAKGTFMWRMRGRWHLDLNLLEKILDFFFSYLRESCSTPVGFSYRWWPTWGWSM